ncbi:UDP-N-acetylmuramoyl-L-alanyl-D-glutamate--2,6-diaminopimelate ligase [Candidatus Peregrinibacteria bacterium]|nr:UDP-N-acetylmuramoyl-L-alanyl-D-glutamate--2,6-diaminopimelate ligase [Candidatus Peregrinibacteria bacterium]
MLNYLRKIISYENPVRIIWHWLRGLIAAIGYNFPAKNMVVIGVTGTNGKTTTSHMIEHILRFAGKKVAMISTVEIRIDGKVKPNKSKKTTLSPFYTQAWLRICALKKIDYVIIEASSHALHQSRLFGIPFSIAVLTNITHEHLDYHGSMKNYARAKKILFKNVSRNCNRKEPRRVQNIPHNHAFILNADDRFYNNFVEIKCNKKVSYGLGKGDLQAQNVTNSKYGSKFAIRYEASQVLVDLHLVGSFNVENALAATGAALNCKLSLEEIKKGLESFSGVPGRMETISSPKGFDVIVDFALTPDALDRLYKTLEETTSNRLIGIIGSCGDRDKKKRPDMGRIVAEHTDITIVTDEEPYSEDPKVIMQAVYEGAKKIKNTGKNLYLIEDRYKAIEFAVKNAEKGDVVVVTGMGNFSTRTMNKGPIKWDERDVVREVIKKYS